jgi:hypothetical protein
VVLDSGPLGLACSRPGTPLVNHCQAWLRTLELAGAEIVIPTIIDYEVRRELVRVNATAKLTNLDDLAKRCLLFDVSARAFQRAAELWAMIRNLGLPTAATQDLDADCILAAVADTAFDPADSVTIATTNVAHLGRFPGIDAQIWMAIT